MGYVNTDFLVGKVFSTVMRIPDELADMIKTLGTDYFTKMVLERCPDRDSITYYLMNIEKMKESLIKCAGPPDDEYEDEPIDIENWVDEFKYIADIISPFKYKYLDLAVIHLAKEGKIHLHRKDVLESDDYIVEYGNSKFYGYTLNKKIGG